MEQNTFKVNRTTLTIYETMKKLLYKNSFDDITVNDICQDAMVSRSTFYAHFADKYQLILFFLEQERNHMGIVKGKNIKENILTILLRMQEKKEIYQNLLLAQTNAELNRMITGHLQDIVNFTLKKVITSPEELQVQTVLFSTGLAGSALWWVEHKFPLEAETFAAHLCKPLETIIYSTGCKF